MAFTVKLRHFNGWTKEETFYVNQVDPYFKEALRDKQFNIESLQADGDELEYVRNKFDRTPITKGGVCIWNGDYAKFIFNNL